MTNEECLKSVKLETESAKFEWLGCPIAKPDERKEEHSIAPKLLEPKQATATVN
ncbi:MAG: hypothetical protein QQW96_14835 [Tychonema bourrellyi B0820]|uniref:hypothetical protein n=1 Tax=Tychonema bourrellyi TaxID=54313 RepID=UPI0015D48214|nr:hypothetical protein [Tychonema bourrellyi]MDQ2098911.1 hypothetical protein [Tychonema bourrellyi B0820]